MWCLILIVGWCCLIGVQATDEFPRIIIVGAGVSGIAAASRLLQNGFNDITILEAENRIGGRIYTKKFGGYNIDVGGQWVHGEEGNAVYDLAWPLGVLEHSVPHPYSKIFSSSEPRITEQTGNELLKAYKKIVGTIIPDEYANKSAGDYFKLKFDEYFDAHPNITVERSSMTNMFESLLAGLYATDSWYNISPRGEYVSCKGDLEINWKDGGYSTILDILMKKFPNPSEELPVVKNTILNAEVQKINYDGPGNGVRLTTANGDEYSGDHVIVTTSIGVLKNHLETMFHPQLPELKKKAIQGLQLGNVVKLLLHYDEPWWNGENAMYMHWTNKDRDELENDPEKSWMLGLTELRGIANKPRILLCWVMGAHSRQLETVPEDRVFIQVKQVIHRFFGKTHNLTEPTAMLRSQWYTNKHFMGTWSYQSPEFYNSGSKTTDLSDPIEKNGKPVVMFAGEVTSRTQYSTVHGAIVSGWREAERLKNFYSDGKKNRDIEKSKSS